jgi:hypothetical protein
VVGVVRRTDPAEEEDRQANDAAGFFSSALCLCRDHGFLLDYHASVLDLAHFHGHPTDVGWQHFS